MKLPKRQKSPHSDVIRASEQRYPSGELADTDDDDDESEEEAAGDDSFEVAAAPHHLIRNKVGKRSMGKIGVLS
jgi:hypothetical protein